VPTPNRSADENAELEAASGPVRPETLSDRGTVPVFVTLTGPEMVRPG
jgi:hypothetical protein